VEDNEINQQVAQEILQGVGFVVEIANDGQEAVDKFLDSNKNVVAEIKEKLRAGGTETATRSAHTIKGVSGKLGAEELFSVAADLEKAIKRREDRFTGWVDCAKFESHLNVVLKGLEALEDRDAAARQAEPPMGEITIDIEVVKPLLVEMAGLLESDFMEAMSRLEALGHHFKDSEVSEEFFQLAKHVEGFDTEHSFYALYILQLRSL